MPDSPVTRGDLDAALQSAVQQIKEHVVERTQAASQQIRDDLTKSMRRLETSLLSAFHGYARGVNARITTHDASYHTLNERMTALEDRMLNVETRGRREN